MKIVLVQAYLGRREPFIYPIGLARLAAAVKDAGHDVCCFDMNTADAPQDELRLILDREKPDMTGFSLRNIDTTQYRDPYLYWKSLPDCVETARKTLPDTKILAGGSGFSLFARELMERIPGIDYGFYMESEKNLPILLDCPAEPEKVPGLFYRVNGKVRFSESSILHEFHSEQDLDRAFFPVDPYRQFHGSIGIESKRGCEKRCAYCTYPFLSGNSIRMRTPRDVVEDMRQWQDKYNVDTFHFVDTLFNNPVDHAKKICREIISRRLQVKWIAWYNERMLDQELLELALQSGCIEFAFSPDGITTGTLNALGKDLSPADINKTFRWAMLHPEMRVSYNFFICPPGDTFKGVIKLFLFAAKVKLFLRNRGRIFLGNIRIEPDTPILKRALRKGMLDNVTNLLPDTPNELKQLFYIERQTAYAHTFFNIIFKLKSYLKKDKTIP